MSGTWTRAAIEALGPITDVRTTASIFQVDPDTIYSQIRRDEWTTTRVLRLGRKIRIPTRDLLSALYGADLPTDPTVPSASNEITNQQVTGSESQSQCGCRVADVEPIHALRGA
ncbi:DNA-binding protein [Streptomyces sp. NPDC058653]|uniref:DNA-binding protein n=1 Tax=Streptomyces sp. NPDC058653 TaxID=3346576 RepID=UPI0036674A64